ncbi:unnamed protein product [Aphanomyces euteiches]
MLRFIPVLRSTSGAAQFGIRAMVHWSFVFSALIAASFGVVVLSHSWIECTDYRPTSDADKIKWNPASCHGRARGSGRQTAAGFGVDTGFNFQGDKCKDPFKADEPDVPRATYTPGQEVCLAYPDKNHVEDKKRPYMPDHGLFITRTKVGDTSDTFDGHTYEHKNGAHVMGQADLKGFQHCLGFDTDANHDKALCTVCFDLEKDLAPGRYAFKWTWAFNNDNDKYSNCWDATVAGGGSAGGGNNSPSPSSPPPGGSGDKVADVPDAKKTPDAAYPSAPSSAPAPAMYKNNDLCEKAQAMTKALC